jgi:hypothetical protein
MSAVAADMGGNGGAPARPALRILVVLRAVNMDRISEGFLRCALDRGHTVRVVLDQDKDRRGGATGGQSLFDRLEREYPEFEYAVLPPQTEAWIHPAAKLRSAIDYLRYFEPEFAEADDLRSRGRSRAPWYMRIPGALGLFRLRSVRKLADGGLRALERRMPLSKRSLAMMREFEPDLVVVSPLVEIGSPQGDHLRAADSLGIPTVLVVASWDNLTTKGVIRDRPDLTIVWNADQVREAVELHGLSEGSVVATGAHSHDHWFDWRPTTSPEEFARKAGLEEGRPFVLYVCSSGFIAGEDEPEFVRAWIQQLATSGRSELEGLAVVVRPHPQNFPSWRDADLEEPGRIVVWPRGGVAPTTLESKRDYFDSLYHAKAVVGINTTALVDSAIVRRPVFTVVSDHFRSTQTGTLHFSYLARDEGGGLLNVARSWDEHLEQLSDALRSPERHRERIDGFLAAFVRPNGLDRPAAPLAVDTLEGAAQTRKEPIAERGPLRWMVGVAATGLGRFHVILRELRPEAMRRRAQRWRKRRIRARRERSRAAKPPKPPRVEKPPNVERPPERSTAEAPEERVEVERTG